MAMKIAILEDDERRRVAMLDRLQDRMPRYETVFFADAAEMIQWLAKHLLDTLAISLDHDLELQQVGDGKTNDPGTDRQIADYLAQFGPQCPVVFHSTNAPAVAGMELTLREAGWTTYRVSPYDDLAWIPDWFATIRRAIIDSAQPAPSSPQSPGASRVLR